VEDQAGVNDVDNVEGDSANRGESGKVRADLGVADLEGFGCGESSFNLVFETEVYRDRTMDVLQKHNEVGTEEVPQVEEVRVESRNHRTKLDEVVFADFAGNRKGTGRDGFFLARNGSEKGRYGRLLHSDLAKEQCSSGFTDTLADEAEAHELTLTTFRLRLHAERWEGELEDVFDEFEREEGEGLQQQNVSQSLRRHKGILTYCHRGQGLYRTQKRRN
jgi:hypothetical protein